MFGDRDRHAVSVHFLEGIGTDHRRGDLGGDTDQRNGIQFGIRNGGHQVGRARPAGGDTHRCFAGGAGDTLCDKPGALLMAGEDMPDPAVTQCIIQRQRRTARNTGYRGDPVLF